MPMHNHDVLLKNRFMRSIFGGRSSSKFEQCTPSHANVLNELQCISSLLCAIGEVVYVCAVCPVLVIRVFMHSCIQVLCYTNITSVIINHVQHHDHIQWYNGEIFFQ